MKVLETMMNMLSNYQMTMIKTKTNVSFVWKERKMLFSINVDTKCVVISVLINLEGLLSIWLVVPSVDNQYKTFLRNMFDNYIDQSK